MPGITIDRVEDIAEEKSWAERYRNRTAEDQLIVLVKGNVTKRVYGNDKARKCEKQGFIRVSDKADDQTKKEAAPGIIQELESMTAKELKEYARDHGITGCSALSKNDVLTILIDNIEKGII